MRIKDKLKDIYKKIAAKARMAARSFWKVLSRNLWMKLLSLLLAILLWNYVISSDTSITRSKVISGINGYVTNQSMLADYGLALLDDPSDMLDDVSVRLEVAQAQFGLASSDNVQVTLDLSRVRSAGTQEVALKAVTSYGRVVNIMPETLTLTFETLDSRQIPVVVEASGTDSENYWYNVSRTNPSTITVSGAASVVRSISQARVYSDASSATSSYVRTEPYVLLDSAGNEISQEMLTRSASSITVMMNVYPTKEIPISTDIEDVVTGVPAQGFSVSSISIQPESITVAADQELLDGILELLVEPISVEGLSNSFSARAEISLLSDFKYASAEQVYVNVTITEENVSEWVSNLSLTFIGKSENLQLDWARRTMQVYVTGPRSVVEQLKENGIPVTVDLTGLTAGIYECTLNFPTETYSNVRFEPEMPAITVTLSEKPEE